MPDTQLYTIEAALALGSLVKTNLLASKLRFFKEGLIVTQYTKKTDLEAVECDFDGYTAGGYTLAAWTGPLVDGNGGSVITSPLVNLAYGTPGTPPAVNQVGGWWVEDAAGGVRLAGNYSPSRPMLAPGNGWSVVIQIVYARNPTVSFDQ